jgi:hypothetical protein
MGLVSDLVDQAFLIISGIDDDLVPSVTYQAVSLGAYTPATDSYAETITSTTIDNAVLSKFTSTEIREGIFEHTDQKLIFPASSLLGVQPQENDRVIIGGVQWNVQEIMGVPGDSLYILRIGEV